VAMKATTNGSKRPSPSFRPQSHASHACARLFSMKHTEYGGSLIELLQFLKPVLISESNADGGGRQEKKGQRVFTGNI